MALTLRLEGASSSGFRLAHVSRWKMGAGLSLGFFVFVPEGVPRSLVVHEYGHTMQSLLLGPLYLPLVVLPSLLWAGLPAARRFRAARGVSYYAHPIEHWADLLGTRAAGEPSLGLLAAQPRA